MSGSKLPSSGLLIGVFSLAISSWFLLHLLAVFGVFLAFVYPVWWGFYPKQTICFLCRSHKEGENCPFCHQPVKKSENGRPRSVHSAIFNGLLILFFSLTSIGIVYLESQVVPKLGFPPTPKTVSFDLPSKGQYRLGEVFPMKIEINGIKTPVNTIQSDVSFDPNKLEIVNITTDDSFANIFIQKEINNEVGYARLTGGLPNPGFSSDHGIFGTIYFKGKIPGIVKVEFLPSSMILANDGRGTNVLKDLSSISYLILPDKISEEEENLQKNATIDITVLGEETKNTQMTFYEEKNVLGVKLNKEIVKVKKEKEPSFFQNLLIKLGEFDKLILDQWSKIFDSF